MIFGPEESEVLECDFVHDQPTPATWGLIGEAGDFLYCDEHYERAGRPKGWHHAPNGVRFQAGTA